MAKKEETKATKKEATKKKTATKKATKKAAVVKKNTEVESKVEEPKEQTVLSELVVEKVEITEEPKIETVEEEKVEEPKAEIVEKPKEEKKLKLKRPRLTYDDQIPFVPKKNIEKSGLRNKINSFFNYLWNGQSID